MAQLIALQRGSREGFSKEFLQYHLLHIYIFLFVLSSVAPAPKIHFDGYYTFCISCSEYHILTVYILFSIYIFCAEFELPCVCPCSHVCLLRLTTCSRLLLGSVFWCHIFHKRCNKRACVILKHWL